MKLRGVERATAEAVDMIPPTLLPTLSSAISSTQLSADTAGCGMTTQRSRQGQLEVDLQIGHSPQETIINKAVTARSPLKGH